MNGQIAIERPPQNDHELWWWVYRVWGIRIPYKKVCPNHVAPFRAFADAYFARHDPIIIKGSRGFSGKSFLLATLTATEAVCLGASATILGGSSAQSIIVHNYLTDMWYAPYAPRELLDTDPTKMTTRLKNGAVIEALLASSTSVRGPHPARLRCDEADEMKLSILDAALGQPMSQKGIPAQTTLSSTHQYPAGTFTELLKRAAENNWKVYCWCYKESMTEWLSAEDVEKKRNLVPKRMFEVEYDLAEPSIEGRAFQTEQVEKTFDTKLGIETGDEGRLYIFEERSNAGLYITGVDWAQSEDFTEVCTFRVDQPVWRLVAYERLGRRAWPEMIDRVRLRFDTYGGHVFHDATGLGKVVHEVLPLDDRIHGIVFTSSTRTPMFTEYVSAIEQGKFKMPRITELYSQHRYATSDDLWGRGHAPDGIVACALAWWGRKILDSGPIHVSSVYYGPNFSRSSEASKVIKRPTRDYVFVNGRKIARPW